MNRVVGLLPGGEVAAGIPASCRRNLQVVVIVDVAGRARHIGVTSGKQESGRAVVELGI